MDSTQTLHDFVLNLLTNPDARSAFQLDPEGSLNEAGLGDITAEDVQDVVPLVADYAPVEGTSGLNPAMGEAGALNADPTSAIGQLQAVTEQLSVGAPSPSADGGLATAGTIAVDTSALDVSATSAGNVNVFAGESGVAADLWTTQDVAGTLDSDVVGPVTANPTGTVGTTVDTPLDTADGLLGGSPVDGLLGGTGAPVDGALGTVNSAGNGLLSQPGDVSGLVDSLGATGKAPASAAEVGGDDTSSLVDGATGTVDDVTGGTLNDPTGTLNDPTGALDGTLDGAGAGGLLDGGDDLAGSGLLEDGTDILF